MKRTTLQKLYVLPMTTADHQLMDRVHQEVLEFARHQTGNPHLEGLTAYEEFDRLCDLLFLSRSGVLSTGYTDSLPDGSEGVWLKLNV